MYYVQVHTLYIIMTVPGSTVQLNMQTYTQKSSFQPRLVSVSVDTIPEMDHLKLKCLGTYMYRYTNI